MTNRLRNETSPYLRQHAYNPVDWYPWGEEALQRARELDRPIFLSVGYSACHWCHVMEHESFEDEKTAKILNDHFVSIKVDREERPDLDQIYMTAVQLLTRQGGWPMSVFLTPTLQPFYGGTYFPPDDRYGRPSFRRVLQAVLKAWQERRQDVLTQAAELTQHIQTSGVVEPSAEPLQEDLLRRAVAELQQYFDPVWGGFGQEPKFPHATEIRLLLRCWQRFGLAEALHMARLTLDRMAQGGIYDHLGGGFHRYSTDARWLVPHFEKMLYDNALLTPAYLEAWQITGEAFYREVVEETLAYVQREMTSPEGPFYSTQDADSEGQEGKFFVWSETEIQQILGEDLGRVFCAVYDITAGGNWEGHNILQRSRSDAVEARRLGLTEAELRRQLHQARQQLLAVRSQRIWPGRDEKVLTSWNGLMIDAFAQAAQVLDRPDYATVATRAADFLLTRMRNAQGQLLRTWSSGSAPKFNAYLEDYAFLAQALVTLYEATFEPRWLEAALGLCGVLKERFWDSQEGGFFYTGTDHEELIARTKDAQDSSIPSGNSMAATALLRLAKLTGRTDLQEMATQTLRPFSGLMSRAPLAAGQMLLALDFHLGPVDEYAVVGDLGQTTTQEVLRLIRSRYQPRRVLAFRPWSGEVKDQERLLPLLEGKTLQGEVTTYICRDFACQAPLVGVEAVKEKLGSG